MKSLIQILKNVSGAVRSLSPTNAQLVIAPSNAMGMHTKTIFTKKELRLATMKWRCRRMKRILKLYRYLSDNRITATQFKGKTLIRRKDIDKLFDEPKPYQKRRRKEPAPITELYSNDKLREKFDVSLSWIFKVGKEENVPKIMRRGKTLWSKKHFDAILARRTHDESITEWYWSRICAKNSV